MTWQDDNRAYWQSRQHDYPFHARQTEHITATYTRPEHLTTARHGSFIRIPLGNEVLWGFTTAAHRDTFVSDFGGEALPESDNP